MFRSIFVPFLIASGTIFVPDLASLGSPDPQRNQKPQKNLIWRNGTKIGPRIAAKIGTRIGPQNWAQNWDQKSTQNWKTYFGLILGPFFGTNFGSSFGAKFRRIQTGISCFDSTLKSGKTRVSVKEMRKPAKPDWKIMQGQHQPSFSTAARLSNYLWKTFLQTPRLCLRCSCRFEPSQRTPAKQRCYLNWKNQRQPAKQTSRSFGRYSIGEKEKSLEDTINANVEIFLSFHFKEAFWEDSCLASINVTVSGAWLDTCTVFRSIFVPAKWFLIASGAIFVPDLASLGSPDPQRNQKPQKEFDLKKWDQNRTQNCGQNRDQNWPRIGTKKVPRIERPILAWFLVLFWNQFRFQFWGQI